MKKVLISMLLVLLTLCLFVSCSDEPKDEPKNSVVSKIEGYDDYKFTFNRDDSCNILGKNSTITFGEDGIHTTVDYGSGSEEYIFSKTNSVNTKIKDFDELCDLSSIYYKDTNQNWWKCNKE